MRNWGLVFLGFLAVLSSGCGDGFHSALPTNTAASFMDSSEPQWDQGKLLYQQNCASCHGTSPDSRVEGADLNQIQVAILIVSQMKKPNIQGLADQELENISKYLQNVSGQLPVANNPPPHGGQPPVITLPTAPIPNTYMPPSATPLQRADSFGETGAQRLTKKQILRTVEQNLKISLQSLEKYLPENSNSSTYFANDYKSLSVTTSLVEKISEFAEKVSSQYKESQLRADIGCRPSGPQDFSCFENFVAKMGRRFFRRPLSRTEIKRFSDALMDYAQQEGRFMAAVELALQAFIQHPEFLYRLEINGSFVGGNQVKLSAYEVATRMAFLIYGQGPDDELLELAKNNQLQTAQQRSAVADEMLKDARALKNFQEFHGHWLGYGEIFTTHRLANDFRLETDKLIEQLHFKEKTDWLQMFQSEKTYLTPALASHYGISGVNRNSWVTLSGDKKSGILSHASFAMIGRKFNDTSPTLRGYEIYKRLYCGEFKVSLPANVDTTEAPGNPNDCKPKRYAMRSLNNCAGCHSITDGIGFGMEKIDPFGNIRNLEPGNPQCEITGEGDVFGKPFVGPQQLAQNIASDYRVGACATEKLFEFMVGRSVTSDDQVTLEALEGQYYQSRSLQEIVKEIVKSEGMAHKRGN